MERLFKEITPSPNTNMSLQLLIAATLFVSSLGAPQPKLAKPQLNGRIVGGVPIDIQDANYQVSLRYSGSHICGGSIISTSFVVTAAHCTDGFPASILSIRAGSTFRDSGGVTINVARVHQNPQYDSVEIDYDISVLELESQLTLSNSIGIIGLPYRNQQIRPEDETFITGWGALTEGGSSPQQLQGVYVPVVGQAECKAAYGENAITDRMMCAGVPEGGRDACQGDSGGPLVIDQTLIGIVSWGYGCARPDYPGVYGSVPSMRDFVESVTGF